MNVIKEVALIRGLTEQEVVERRNRGLGNPLPPSTGRTVGDILRYNISTSINIIIFFGDAVTSGGPIFINAVVGIVQELRAKRQLDRIAFA